MRGKCKKQREAGTEYSENGSYKVQRIIMGWRGWMTIYSHQKCICDRTIFQKCCGLVLNTKQ